MMKPDSRAASSANRPSCHASAEIAALAPLSVRHSKRVLNDDGAYEDQSGLHKEMFDAAWGSRDVIEAQVARVEKRAPRFQGA